jgi:hypothetical protein
MTLVLEQQGNKVSGTLNGSAGFATAVNGPLQGAVDGNHFIYSLTNGQGGAELTVNGDEMVGWGKSGNRLILHRERR